MYLNSSVHPLLTPKNIALLKTFNIRSLSSLLSLKPERLCSILSQSYSDVMQMRNDLFKEYGSFPSVGLGAYQTAVNEEYTLQSGCKAIDDTLGGGFQGGQVYEAFGCSGSGKTQLCLTVAAMCAINDCEVIYVDTKGDFCPSRFAEILESRGGGNALMLNRIKIVKISTYKDLIDVTEKIEQIFFDTKLIVIDNITYPIMAELIENNSVKIAFGTGCTVGQNLHKLSKQFNAVILFTSNMRGGSEKNLPALGRIWSSLADIRLFLNRSGEEAWELTISRGINNGKKVDFKIDIKGMTNLL